MGPWGIQQVWAKWIKVHYFIFHHYLQVKIVMNLFKLNFMILFSASRTKINCTTVLATRIFNSVLHYFSIFGLVWLHSDPTKQCKMQQPHCFNELWMQILAARVSHSQDHFPRSPRAVDDVLMCLRSLVQRVFRTDHRPQPADLHPCNQSCCSLGRLLLQESQKKKTWRRSSLSKRNLVSLIWSFFTDIIWTFHLWTRRMINRPTEMAQNWNNIQLNKLTLKVEPVLFFSCTVFLPVKFFHPWVTVILNGFLRINNVYGFWFW